MKFIIKWHNWARKHLILINVVVVFATLAMGLQLKDLKFNADWLALFSPTDAKIVNYQKLIGNSGTNSLFFKIDPKDLKKFTAIIPAQPIRPDWYKVELDPNKKIEAQKESLRALKTKLKQHDINYQLTGSLEILEQFGKSVQQDFTFTSIITAILILLVTLWFYGLNPVVIYGFMAQLFGMVCGLYLYSLFYDHINLITATFPCILLGLGIDFSIHSATICSGSHKSRGLQVYQKVARPLFWGVVTTSIAFFSLCFNLLSGLIPSGILGGISLFTMYFSVMILMPPFASRFPMKKTRGMKQLNLPLFSDNRNKKTLLAITSVFLIFAMMYIPKLQFEDKSENLYDPNLVALQNQQELTQFMGMNPTPLFINLPDNYSTTDLIKLQKGELFQLMPPASGLSQSLLILSKANPFDRKNFNDLKSELNQLLQQDVSITGAPTICHHLNNLLLEGMINAFIAVFIFIFLLMLILFKKIKPALAVAAILILSTAITLALMAFFNIKLSTYTLILFPMLLGIGIDDCLHIVFQQSLRGRKIKSNDQIIKAITLTTITTIIGYGSLMLAKNEGFVAMGVTSTLGIATFFVITLYFLPSILPKDKQ